MRNRGIVAGLALLLLPLTACGNVCPAVGWSNTLHVQFDGDSSAVNHVQICADGRCSSPLPDGNGVLPEDEPLRTMVPGQLGTAPPPEPGERPTGGVAGGPDSPPQPTVAVSESIYVSVEQTENGRWHVSMTEAPERMQVRAVSENGEVLAEREIVLDWHRVGGSARCGGPSEADVTVALGA